MRKCFRNILHSLVRRSAVLTPGILSHCVRQVTRNLPFCLARFARRTVSASATSFCESAAFPNRHGVTLWRLLSLRTLRRMRHSLPRYVRICCLLERINPICVNAFEISNLHLLACEPIFTFYVPQNVKMVLTVGYCRTVCVRLLATCFGVAPLLRS